MIYAQFMYTRTKYEIFQKDFFYAKVCWSAIMVNTINHQICLKFLKMIFFIILYIIVFNSL